MSNETPNPEGEASADVEVSDVDVLMRLAGPNNTHLRVLEDELEVSLGLRGNTIRIVGERDRVAEVVTFLAELAFVMEKKSLPLQELKRAARTAMDHPGIRIRDLVNDVVLRTSSKRAITPKSVAQQTYIHSVESYDVVFGIGPAGTGKTYLAMAMAVAALMEKRAKRIILTRPAVEAGEKLGFLPGDLTEKVNPYLRPLYDALHDMIGDEKAAALMERGTIEVAPLAFMRGRTLNDAFVILDEAQNTTPAQMKMFLTRLGFRSQAVITGDITQVDLPNGQSGLRDAERLLKNVEGIGFNYFSEEDVVRHPLVRRIIRAYDERDSKRRAEREAREQSSS